MNKFVKLLMLCVLSFNVNSMEIFKRLDPKPDKNNTINLMKLYEFKEYQKNDIYCLHLALADTVHNHNIKLLVKKHSNIPKIQILKFMGYELYIIGTFLKENDFKLLSSHYLSQSVSLFQLVNGQINAKEYLIKSNNNVQKRNEYNNVYITNMNGGMSKCLETSRTHNKPWLKLIQHVIGATQDHVNSETNKI